jgi:hypothetical protein
MVWSVSIPRAVFQPQQGERQIAQVGEEARRDAHVEGYGVAAAWEHARRLRHDGDQSV